MVNNYQKQIQTKLAKGLLDMILLQFLSKESMHGYQIITRIRKDFGIYFGPSTVYPLLGKLEKKGYVKSTWNMETGKRHLTPGHLTLYGALVFVGQGVSVAESGVGGACEESEPDGTASSACVAGTAGVSTEGEMLAGWVAASGNRVA